MTVEISAIDNIHIIRMQSGGENRFNRELLDSLAAAFDHVEAEPRSGAVVLTGDGKFFSNGLDLGWVMSQPQASALDFFLDFNAFLRRLLVYPLPVLAAINGHAFAGGLFLALCTDWRALRQDRGWLSFPEVTLGIDLPPGSVGLVQHVVGGRKADYLFLTARKIASAEALALGLVDALAPEAELLPKCIEMARELAAKPRAKYADHKRQLRATPARLMAEEDELFVRATWGGMK
jgi:Delta3-Delta2-enoyl-CoA isomerase